MDNFWDTDFGKSVKSLGISVSAAVVGLLINWLGSGDFGPYSILATAAAGFLTHLLLKYAPHLIAPKLAILLAFCIALAGSTALAQDHLPDAKQKVCTNPACQCVDCQCEDCEGFCCLPRHDLIAQLRTYRSQAAIWESEASVLRKYVARLEHENDWLMRVNQQWIGHVQGW